jgi:hypothetical protein
MRGFRAMQWRMVVRGGAMLTTTAILSLGAATVASAAGRWRPVHFPLRETADDYAVSCVSASSCYLAGAEGKSAFMHFDGRRLSARPAPPFGPQINSDLESLACTSARFCMAVGDRGGLPATADRWNGNRWSVTPVPVHVPASSMHAKFGLSGLISVACPSSSMCLAVGGWYAFDSHRLAAQGQIVVRWNGTRWSTVTVPVKHAVLLSVACASTDDCVAFGGHVASHLRGVVRPISMRLHDGHWSPLAFRTPRGVTKLDPNSVSCPAAGACVAVGSALRAAMVAGKRRRLERALVLRQRGNSWIARTLPAARSVSRLVKGLSAQSLTSVSCPPGAGSACVAVGTWGSATAGLNPPGGGLAATLSPGRVRMRPLNDPEPSTISCPTVQFCLAAGNESIERFHRGFSGNFIGRPRAAVMPLR